MPSSNLTAVYLETGQKRVFASARDWPGWSRSGKDEAGALEALAASASRYAQIAAEAGLPFDDQARPTVVARLVGSATTDFGAPGASVPEDAAPLASLEAERLAALVAAAWRVFDRVVAAAPEVLRKGPRGGGRDRDAIVEHVLEAETAYARKLGLRHHQARAQERAEVESARSAILEALRRSSGPPALENGWPARYAARRIAWHVVDHAWEIEDRAEPAPS